MKKLAVVILLVGMLAMACLPFSVVDQCYRPQDVLSVERFYDQATDTWIQFVPTDQFCTPLNFPDEVGIKYVRLQWWRQHDSYSSFN